MNEQQHKDLYDFLQSSGNAISDVFDQMLKGGWVDEEGHLVPLNKAMLNLKDVLENAIELNKRYYNA